MLGSLFNKAAVLKACNFVKRMTPTQAFSCEICKFCKNTYFQERLANGCILCQQYFGKGRIFKDLPYLSNCKSVKLVKVLKQPPEVFCKKSCSNKFCKIHRETPVPGSLF